MSSWNVGNKNPNFKYNISKRFLIKKYIRNKKSTPTIAKEIGCSNDIIYYYLKKYNIEIRSISKANKGNPKISHKGKKNGNYKDGRCLIKQYCIDCGKKISMTSFYGGRKCQSCANFKSSRLRIKNRKECKEENHWNWNPERHKKHYCKEKDCDNEISYNTWKWGKRRCQWCCKKGKRNNGYIHGQGNKPYSLEFNDKLKLKIRKRDNFTCQLCSMTEKKHIVIYGKVLTVHHIDYDKENCKEENLISLCGKCNIRANYNKDYYYAYFTYIIEEK